MVSAAVVRAGVPERPRQTSSGSVLPPMRFVRANGREGLVMELWSKTETIETRRRMPRAPLGLSAAAGLLLGALLYAAPAAADVKIGVLLPLSGKGAAY